jgi:hypothetical protein
VVWVVSLFDGVGLYCTTGGPKPGSHKFKPINFIMAMSSGSLALASAISCKIAVQSVTVSGVAMLPGAPRIRYGCQPGCLPSMAGDTARPFRAVLPIAKEPRQPACSTMGSD